MNAALNPVRQVDQALYYILGISVILLIIITIVSIVFIIKYRRSNHPKAADIRGNIIVEIVWTIIPTIIVLIMFALGWSSYTGLRSAPDDSLEILVEAQMFSWLFIYPENDDRESENELVVPQGRSIKLCIQSLDVIHSFFAPAFRIKVDAVKNMETYVWFQADTIGEYDILCTEYCGVAHADMTGTIKVVSQEDFNSWIEEDE